MIIAIRQLSDMLDKQMFLTITYDNPLVSLTLLHRNVTKTQGKVMTLISN